MLGKLGAKSKPVFYDLNTNGMIFIVQDKVEYYIVGLFIFV